MEVQRAKTKVPTDIHVQTMDGIVLVMKNQLDAAEPILVNALQKRPDLAFANHSLGIIRKHQGRTEESEQLMLEEVRLHPPALPARRALVEIMAEQKRYAEQLEQLSAIETIESANPLTLHSQAQALFNLKRYQEAAEKVDACIEQRADYPGCMMLKANVLAKLGDKDAAQKAYEAAMKLVGRTPAKKGKSATELPGLPAAAANPPR